MMNAKEPVRIAFSEEDTLFRLMEMALKRQSTPEGEKTLNYFFGPDHAAPQQVLTTMADRLGLPGAAREPAALLLVRDRDQTGLYQPRPQLLRGHPRRQVDPHPAQHRRRALPRHRLSVVQERHL